MYVQVPEPAIHEPLVQVSSFFLGQCLEEARLRSVVSYQSLHILHKLDHLSAYLCLTRTLTSREISGSIGRL